MKSPMMFAATLAALALFTACGGSDDEGAAPPAETSAASQPASDEPELEATSDGAESAECRIAAAKWANRIDDLALEVLSNSILGAQAVNTGDLDDVTSEVKILCSEDLWQVVAKGNAAFAEANFEVSLCGFANECDDQQAKKVKKSADEATGLAAEVSRMVGG